jgi:hypothetical protein
MAIKFMKTQDRTFLDAAMLKGMAPAEAHEALNNLGNMGAEEIASDPDAASWYVAGYIDEAERLASEINWESSGPFCVGARLYGHSIKHELRPRTLHATECWGEFFWANGDDPVMFPTYDCFIAFILEKFW